jgi:hypothetical protein
MTEQYNTNPEGEFADKRVKELDINGIKCELELHVLPNFINADIALNISTRVAEEAISFLDKKDIRAATINLVEGRNDNDRGREPYRLSMVFGGGSDNEGVAYLRKKIENKKIVGYTRLVVDLPLEPIGAENGVDLTSDDLPLESVGVEDRIDLTPDLLLEFVKLKNHLRLSQKLVSFYLEERGENRLNWSQGRFIP